MWVKVRTEMLNVGLVVGYGLLAHCVVVSKAVGYCVLLLTSEGQWALDIVVMRAVA